MTDYQGNHPSGEPAPDSDSPEMTSSKKEWLENLPPLNERMKKPSDLPKWAKLGLTMYGVGHCETMKEAAKEVDKAPGTFYNYKNTPAGEEWLSRVEEIADSPERLSEMVLKANLHTFTLDFISMWQAAVDANDFVEIRKMWESINDRVPGGLAKSGELDMGSASITINFGSTEDLEPVEIESDFEEVEDADYEMIEGD